MIKTFWLKLTTWNRKKFLSGPTNFSTGAAINLKQSQKTTFGGSNRYLDKRTISFCVPLADFQFDQFLYLGQYRPQFFNSHFVYFCPFDATHRSKSVK